MVEEDDEEVVAVPVVGLLMVAVAPSEARDAPA